MRSVEKTAKTYEEALDAALKDLDASINDVEVNVLEEGSKGLFGLFGSRPTKIRVTLKQQEEEEDLLSILGVKKEAPKAPEAPKAAEAPKVVEAPKVPAPKAEPAAQEQPKAEPVRREARRAEKPVKAAEPVKTEEPREEPVRETAAAEAEQAPAAENAAEQTAAPEQKKRPPRHRGARSKQPRPAEGNAEEAPAAEKKPLPPKAPAKPIEKLPVTMIADEELVEGTPAAKARDFLKELTGLMGVDVQIAMGTDTEGNVFAQMTGDTLGVLIGRRGETLDALQYLTSLKVNRGQEGYTRVTLDTENYRAKREDTLIRLANRMANKAVKTDRKVSLEPMNPYERRIIHSALQANELVDTHSEGEEPNRHVVITLRKA